jgi:hypothetical protein
MIAAAMTPPRTPSTAADAAVAPDLRSACTVSTATATTSH